VWHTEDRRQYNKGVLKMPRYFAKWLSRSDGEQPSPQHLVASQYWRTCSNTFLADPEYYDKCEAELQTAILPRLGMVRRLLDAGCGNGRFTIALARAALAVDAFDLSPELIRQAREAAKSAGANNVRFRVGNIAAAKWSPSAYDVASCMGVLSTIIDDWAFLKVSRQLRNTVRPDGLVLLRETVSLLPEGQLAESDTYAIRYRNEDQYRRTFENLGMLLEYETTLIESGTLRNRMYLYRVQSGPSI
jgi:2-polyprenyl-3-methyl-5-hydroxy-6-metoxy-1,4-benzoquinol methylase